LRTVSIRSEGLANNAFTKTNLIAASIIEGIQVAFVASSIPRKQQKVLENHFKCLNVTFTGKKVSNMKPNHRISKRYLK
jgi:hypothetical protein